MRVPVLACCALLLAVAPAQAAPRYSHRVVVGFAAHRSAGDADRAVERHGGVLVRRMTAIRAGSSRPVAA